MLLALATASGKTFLAELAMLKAALQSKRSLYIVPLRALAAEKFDSFQRFKDLGVSVGISTGDFDKKDERLGRNQIIIATSEKADSLMRNGASWIRDLAVLVIDEIHLLNDVGRGPTLEMTITKLRRSNSGLQIIGLSATVANSRELADWLDAELVSSDWRPIALKEGVICKGRLVFSDEERALEAKKDEKDESIALVRDTLSQDAQILIFENSRRMPRLQPLLSNLILQIKGRDPVGKHPATGEARPAIVWPHVSPEALHFIMQASCPISAGWLSRVSRTGSRSPPALRPGCRPEPARAQGADQELPEV